MWGDVALNQRKKTMQNKLKVRITKTIEFYETVPMDDVDENIASETGDPAVDIPRRVTTLAHLLGCDEGTAERILLG